jgi:LuxR family maltose regulon positive regulatory protein
LPITLLNTKLYIPPIRSGLVARPRLVERLESNIDCKLTLVSAPAGFGKTTLLSEWIHEQKRSAAWISLDKGDNDLTRFLAYFISAFRDIEGMMLEESLAMIESPQLPSMEVLLTPLINSATESRTQFALILDDYHLITNTQVHDVVRFILDNIPPNMHLVLSSRADPPWPLSRMRALGEMAEIRANDLRFTPEEVTTFLNDVMGFDLSPADIKLLESRTEGWIAGLQMAAISMQGRKDLSGFIKALSGSHRFIMDYLVEEVIDKQSREIQEFLLKTSILGRMNGPLCDFVTGGSHCQETLDYLEQANLFLIHLDEERSWYRYHHLFSGLLRSYQEQYRPGRAPELHLKASMWYEGQGLIADAVEHALAAGDLERVVSLVEGNAIAMMDHGQLGTLRGWLDAIPDEIVLSRPWLCLAQAWIHVYSGQLHMVEPLLLDAEKGLENIEDKKAITHIKGHMAAIRAYHAELYGDFDNAIAFATEAQHFLPREDLRTRCFTLMKLSSTLRLTGKFNEATQAFKEAILVSQEIGDSHIAIHVRCDLAGLLFMQGRLREIDRVCLEALDIAKQHFVRSGWWMPITGYVYAKMCQLYYERNELDNALQAAEKGIDLCRTGGLPEYLADCYVFQAITYQAMGNGEEAIEAIREAKMIAKNLSPWYKEIVEPYEALIQMSQGDLESARRLVDERDFIRKDEYGIEFYTNKIMQAQIQVKQCEDCPSELNEVHKLLVELREIAESREANSFILKILALQSLTEWMMGEREEALQCLRQAIILAEPEGYVRPFINLGPQMADVLHYAVSKGICSRYSTMLLEALAAEPSVDATQVATSRAALEEPLSERELQVLKLLNSDLSTPEIAQELVVAVSTVRSHVKNIYSKLDVHSRIEAIDRARELNLL